ncbi:MAG: AMP-binding protein [Desulfobacteraceae bacterium]|nr:AMP-binding protein [Desulfobacteraceae bacterium]
MPPTLPTIQALAAGLAEHGGRSALLTMEAEGRRVWSYAELGEAAGRVAAGLAARGIGPGDRVALLAETRAEWIAACLGAFRAGAAVMPLDVQLGDDSLAHILADGIPRLLFTTRGQAERIGRLGPGQPLDLVLLDAGKEDERSCRRLAAASAADLPEVGPGDPAALFYTSGTTGPPKGVPLTHRNIAFQIEKVRETGLLYSRDRVLLPLPLHHVYPFVIGLLVPLGLGLPLVFPHALTGPQILRAIREEEVTAVIGVPRLYRALVSGIEAQVAGRGRTALLLFRSLAGLSTGLRRHLGLRLGKTLLRPLHRQLGHRLRVLASGGSALDPELGWKLQGLGWEVAIGYGLTETAPLLTINPPGSGRLTSVGRPVPGVEIRIDPAARPQETPSDSAGRQTSGEVLARGPNVFAGYRHLPEQSAQAFTSDGWFRTGDLGYLDRDGFLVLQGRVSTLIVTESGKNIQPDEVEEHYAAHPFILEAGVLQHHGRLVAVIVPDLAGLRRAGEKEIEQAIRRAVTEQGRKLPSYQRLDEYAISRDALARTRLGKIRRHLLPGRYTQAKTAATAGRVEAGPLPLAEMSDHDRSLLDVDAARLVWEWLAGRYPEARLTPDTSPHLDLGIDSLEWLGLTMEIGQRTGIELTEEAIGRVETVRDLLHEVAGQAGKGEAASPVRPLEEPEKVIDNRQRHWLEPLNPVQLGLAWGLYHLNRFLARTLFRLEVRGLDAVPLHGQFVLAPNHVSLLDPFALAAALPFSTLRRTYFAGWTGIAFRNAFFRFVSRLARAVPIDPKRAVASSLAFAAVVLKRGENLIWFPEGERSPSGSLQAFKPGLGMLLDRYRVPVVPAFIRGAYEALPRGRSWPRFTRIVIDFGEPVHPGELVRRGEGGPPPVRITRGLHERMAALRDRE